MGSVSREAGLPEKPGELTVMSWAGGWGSALRAAVSEPFTAETGIPVRHEINIGLKLPAELSNALEQGSRPPFDVVWSNSVPALRAAAAGRCSRLDSFELPNVLRCRQGAATDAEGFFVAMVYEVHYILVYRNAAIAYEEPDSWAILADPAFKGKVALYPGGN